MCIKEIFVETDIERDRETERERESERTLQHKHVKVMTHPAN